ncbi:MAG: Fic family protein [Pleomorphochaeta sp.]
MIKEHPPKFNKTDVLALLIKHIDNNKIKNAAINCNSPYLYWDKVKYKTPNENIEKEDFWRIVKFIRSLNYNKIKFNEFTFYFSQTNEINKYLNELDLSIKHPCEKIDLISESNKKYFYLNSLYEEAIASSIMEGATTTRKIAKEYLRKNKKTSDKNIKMIINNYLTMEYIVKNKDLTMDRDKLLNIHKKITHNTLLDSKDEGSFRKSNDVHVADIAKNELIYQPPNYLDIDNLINQLCQFCNNDNYTSYFIHPIIKAIIIHFTLAFIHPFVDGNGRCARAIVYWYLLKEGYNLTQYLAISRIIQKSKIQYEDSYLKCEYDNNDLTYFIIYNLKAIIKAKEEFFNYVEKTLNKRGEITHLISENKISENQAIILNELNNKKDYFLTVIEVQHLLSVSNQTARSTLESLVSKNYLKKINLNKNKFGYMLNPLNINDPSN